MKVVSTATHGPCRAQALRVLQHVVLCSAPYRNAAVLLSSRACISLGKQVNCWLPLEGRSPGRSLAGLDSRLPPTQRSAQPFCSPRSSQTPSQRLFRECRRQRQSLKLPLLQRLPSGDHKGCGEYRCCCCARVCFGRPGRKFVKPMIKCHLLVLS